MLIKTEDLAPKNIINFYLPAAITESGNSLLFYSVPETDNSLLTEIFDTTDIVRCFVSENLLSVQYSENSDKEDIKALVLAYIDDYMQENNRLLSIADKADLLTKSEALADALIRPTLNRDKGDIAILSCADDVLELRFTGHCAGCPYAQNTLQNIIVRTFKQYLPQIKEIKLKE